MLSLFRCYLCKLAINYTVESPFIYPSRSSHILLFFFTVYRVDYHCFIYCATLRLGPLTPPPSGDHDLLSHQLNASRLKKKPGPILISCYLFRSCFFTLFPFWPGSPSCFLRGSLLRCDCCMKQSPRRKSMWRQKVVHGYVKKKIGEKKGVGNE